MPSQLEVDRLLLVAHPLVRSNGFEAGEDQPRIARPARPPARSSPPSPRTAEPAAPATTDPRPRSCVPPGCGAARSDRRALPVRGASRPRRPGPAGEPRPAQGPGSWPGAVVRASGSASARRARGSVQRSRIDPPADIAEIGRHDLLLGSQERLHRVLEGQHGVDRQPRVRSNSGRQLFSSPWPFHGKEIGSGSAHRLPW